MRTLFTDVRLALRFLRRQPAFSITSVGIVALGIGFSTTLFAVIQGGLIAPWPYRGYDRIVTVAGNYPAQGRADFSLWSVPEIEDLRRASIFDAVIAGDAMNVNLTYEGRPERVRAARITPNAFAMLGVAPERGRALQDNDAAPGAAPVVVVSHNFWSTRLGGSTNVVGDTLRIGETSHTIVGVMPEAFTFWGRDLWLPQTLDATDARTARRYYVQARLADGVSIDRAGVVLAQLAERLRADHPEVAEYAGFRVELRPLVESVLRTLRPILYILVAAVGLLVAVACANLANAMLAKGLSRERELAVRRALGATALQLARPLAIESLVLAVLGGVAGLVLAAALLPWMLSLIPYGYIPAEAHIALDSRVVWFAAIVAIATSVLVGVMPTVRAARVQPGQLLKRADARTGSARTHRWRLAFIVMQLSLAVVVVGAASAWWLDMRAQLIRELGFTIDDIWTSRVTLPSTAVTGSAGARFYDELTRRIAASPGIDRVALASLFPLGSLPTVLAVRDDVIDPAMRASVDVGQLAVSPEYFELLRQPLVAGRAFSHDDNDGRAAVAIVSRALATRLWPDVDPIGRVVTIHEAGQAVSATIVGVAGDVRPDPGALSAPALIYRPIAQAPPPSVALGIAARAGVDARAIARAAVDALDRDVPMYNEEPLRQTLINVLGPQLLAVTLLGAFAFSALLLSSAGIHAVMSQSVIERRREIGIRLTLGATPRRVFASELARSQRLVLASLAIGIPLAIVALRISAGWSRATSNSTTIAPLLAAVVVALVALAATTIPAWRASRADVAAAAREL